MVKAFHTLGAAPENIVAIGQAQPGVAPATPVVPVAVPRAAYLGTL
jgi:hypothetical protein